MNESAFAATIMYVYVIIHSKYAYKNWLTLVYLWCYDAHICIIRLVNYKQYIPTVGMQDACTNFDLYVGTTYM